MTYSPPDLGRAADSGPPHDRPPERSRAQMLLRVSNPLVWRYEADALGKPHSLFTVRLRAHCIRTSLLLGTATRGTKDGKREDPNRPA